MGQKASRFKKAVAEALDQDDSLYAFPNERFYDKDHVRRYNLDIKTEPVVVVYPRTTEQVSRLIKLAGEYGLKAQAKSGGHSYANFNAPDGGMLINLKHFQKFEMNTSSWQATVGAGTRLGELTKRLYEPHRRAMAHGTCPGVGVGGHATIGGLGPSSRQWGATLDHVLEVEIVVASGGVVRASESKNADLFWAVRGAGASFGIITEFVFKTHPAPGKTIEYSYAFTGNDAVAMATTFKAYQNLILRPEIPRTLAPSAIVTEAGLTIYLTFYGTEEEFDAVLAKTEWNLRSQN